MYFNGYNCDYLWSCLSFSVSFPGVQKPLDQYGSAAVGATGGEEEKDEEEKNEDDDDFELFGSDDNDDAEEVSGDVQQVGMYWRWITCSVSYSYMWRMRLPRS